MSQLTDRLKKSIVEIEVLENCYDNIFAQNVRLRGEVEVRMFNLAGFRVIKSDSIPVGEIWINSNYDLNV